LAHGTYGAVLNGVALADRSVADALDGRLMDGPRRGVGVLGAVREPASQRRQTVADGIFRRAGSMTVLGCPEKAELWEPRIV
jgi:hypothetical protein